MVISNAVPSQAASRFAAGGPLFLPVPKQLRQGAGKAVVPLAARLALAAGRNVGKAASVASLLHRRACGVAEPANRRRRVRLIASGRLRPKPAKAACRR